MPGTLVLINGRYLRMRHYVPGRGSMHKGKMKSHYLGTVRSSRLEKLLLEMDESGEELRKYNETIDELYIDYIENQLAKKHSIIALQRLLEVTAHLVNLNKRVEAHLQSYVRLGRHYMECPHCKKGVRISVDREGIPHIAR